MTLTKADRTRRRILESAATVFAAQGYAGTSLRHVADGAGLQLGSLYFHFASKDALLGEVVTDAVQFAEDRVRAALEARGSGATGRDRLSAAIRAHLQALHERSERGAAVVRIVDLPRELAATGARRHVRRYAQSWSALVEAAQRDAGLPADADTVVVRNLILGAMRATVGPRQLSPAQVDSVADTVIALVLR
ncbi:MAG TPA: TetR family transcriptional regulator [Marmoricola sp.]|nr:TetR family transcriptional regulator [Marmoricola sp.]